MLESHTANRTLFMLDLRRFALCFCLLPGAACADDASSGGGQPAVDAGAGEADGSAERPVAAVNWDMACNPVGVPHDCLLPYPSDWHRASGEVSIADVALPSGPNGLPLRINRGRPLDGFATHPPILAFVPGALDLSDAVGAYDPAEPSVASTHPTVLLELGDGGAVAVPHFVERDEQTDDLERSALILRPLVPLTPGARHVAAVRQLRDADGDVVARGPFMEELVAGSAFDEPAIDAEADRLREHVLAPLAEFGVAADELLLAWDFTVRSDASVMADLESMRVAVDQWLEAEEPRTRVDSVDVGEDAVRVRGTLEVPLFVDSDAAGAAFVRGDDDLPLLDGSAEIPFFAFAAPEVWSAEAELPVVLQFGHGFFGDRFEIDQGTHVATSRDVGAILFAIDNWGLAGEDSGVIAGDLVSNPATLMRFTDRLAQGFVNQWVFTEVLRGALAEQLGAEGAPRYDADVVAYLGISNGHILGGAQAALNGQLDAVVLQSGGASFSFMMSRAAPFAPLMQLVATWLEDPLDRQKFVAFAAETMDPIDPITWAAVLREQGTPVLMQLGVGDSTVPNVAGHLHARALGLPLLTPSPRTLPAFVTTTVEAAEESVLFEADYGIDEANWPDRNARPPGRDEGNGVHRDPRLDPRMNAQIRAFVRDREITHPCGDRPCEP